MTSPECVRCELSRARASPKSSSLTRPVPASSQTLAGLTSRWTRPLACAAARPECDLAADAGGLQRRQPGSRVEPRLQRLPGQKLHGHVRPAVGFADLVDRARHSRARPRPWPGPRGGTARGPPARPAGRTRSTLRATRRFSHSSSASKTMPIPPAPSSRTRRYWPSRAAGHRVVAERDESRRESACALDRMVALGEVRSTTSSASVGGQELGRGFMDGGLRPPDAERPARGEVDAHLTVSSIAGTRVLRRTGTRLSGRRPKAVEGRWPQSVQRQRRPAEARMLTLTRRLLETDPVQPHAVRPAVRAAERRPGLEPGGRVPLAVDLVGILLCMVFARSAAMAFNRLADRRIDALNPRTAGRHLPAGTLSVSVVAGFTVPLFASGSSPRRSCSCSAPSRTTGRSYLSGPVLAVHLPVLVDEAVHGAGPFLAGRVAACWPRCRRGSPFAGMDDLDTPLLIGGAVFFWVAGFDILYACQDADVRPAGEAAQRAGAARRAGRACGWRRRVTRSCSGLLASCTR